MVDCLVIRGAGDLTGQRPGGTNTLSAAQPKPKDPGEINALVPGLALRRAALPNMRVRNELCARH